MNHLAAAEEQIVNERLRRKLNEVNLAAQDQLSGVQDHVNFTLQQAYFKCAYECFDRRRKQEEIGNCVEHCSVPVVSAQHLIEGEMARFQLTLETQKNSQLRSSISQTGSQYLKERLQRSLMVCQDKFETAKLQQIRTEDMKNLESCVEQSIQESISTLPHLVEKLKSSLSMRGKA